MVATERRSGITRQLLQILENSRDRIVTIEQLAEVLDYNKSNISTLLNQVRKNRPQLIIECPTPGAFVYRGVRQTGEVIDEALSAKPPTTPRHVDGARAAKTSPKLGVDRAQVGTGDLVEVIGFSQDGTPIARDQAGKLYLLNQL